MRKFIRDLREQIGIAIDSRQLESHIKFDGWTRMQRIQTSAARATRLTRHQGQLSATSAKSRQVLGNNIITTVQHKSSPFELRSSKFESRSSEKQHLYCA